MSLFDRKNIGTALLVLIAALPLVAHAADSDGDGVDDSLDAFPTKPEATTDTDGDGQPNSIDTSKLTPLTAFGPGPGWSSPDGWYGAATNVTSSMMILRSRSFWVGIYVPPTGGSISFKVQSLSSWPETAVYGLASGTTRYTGPMNTTYTYNFAGGVRNLSWNVSAQCLHSCTVFSHQFSNLSATNVYVASSLTEDNDDDGDGVSDASDKFPLDPAESADADNDGTGNNADLDDDNDGVPDYIDAAPLNAGNANERNLSLNAGFKGSAVHEAVSP